MKSVPVEQAMSAEISDLEQAYKNVVTHVERTYQHIGGDDTVTSHLKGMMDGMTMLRDEVRILEDSRKQCDQATGIV